MVMPHKDMLEAVLVSELSAAEGMRSGGARDKLV